MPKAVVVGAGIGGIATALRLQHKGYQVTVIEANPYVGGKLHERRSNGYRFDLGPSLFTMPHYVTELFALYGIDHRPYFQFTKKDIVCNYFWEDGTRFSAPSDENLFVTEAARVFKETPNGLKTYLGRNKKKFDLTAPLFLEKSLHKSNTYLSKNTLKALFQIHKLDVHTSLDNTNQRFLKHPKLVQLFNRYATYNGSSPYSTPGIMSMIPHLEMTFGTFYPKGGMHRIGQSLYTLAQEQKIRFQLQEKASLIAVDKGIANAVVIDRDRYPADLVVSNMDIYPTYKKLLKGEKQPRRILAQERSSSALIFYWGISREFPDLDLHNILYTENYPEEFHCLFKKRTLYHDPTVYINITSKQDSEDAPPGHENWFVMINAPANHEQDWDKLTDTGRNYVLDKINRIFKINLRDCITTEHVMTPLEIEQNTASFRGALYGTSSNSKFAAFLRHPNFSRHIKNLYFCGGSVHPGGGIPLCLLSAKIIADLVPNAQECQ